MILKKLALLIAVGALALVLPVGLLGCDDGAATSGQSKGGPMRVAVTIAPLKGLVAPLLPEGSTVETLIPPGLSPHGAELTPSALAAAASADLVVGVGFGLDTSALAAANEQNVVLFQRVAELLPTDGHEDHDHAGHVHDETCEHGHDHGGADPHVWLDPALCAALVTHLTATLEPRVDDMQALHTRSDALLADIQRIDHAYREQLAAHEGAGVVTHHNAWQRLADRYGFEVLGVIRTIETSEPTPVAIAEAVEAVRTLGARVIVVEPQFDPGAARRVAELTGAPVATLDPIGDGDWGAMMERNLGELVRAFEGGRADGVE